MVGNVEGILTGRLGRGRSQGVFRGGGQSPQPLLLPPQASLSEGGAPCPERPVHLLSQGTLGSDPAGEQTLHRRWELWAGLRVEKWGAKILPCQDHVPSPGLNFPTCKMTMMSGILLG